MSPSPDGEFSTSMEEIVRKANLSAGAVYLYYKSKDELILAAAATYIQKLKELLLPILTRKDVFPPSVCVRELTKAIVSHTQRNDLDLNVVMLMVWSEAQSNPKVKELLAGARKKYRDALTGVVRSCRSGGDIAPKGKPAGISKRSVI
jgi:TetR/AcrR family transcriptional regulator, transcriptional repressor of aconitase